MKKRHTTKKKITGQRHHTGNVREQQHYVCTVVNVKKAMQIEIQSWIEGSDICAEFFIGMQSYSLVLRVR